MKSAVIPGLAAALLWCAAAQAADVEVIHWQAGSGQAVASGLAERFAATGADRLVETPITPEAAARATIMRRVLAGDPPAAAQFTAGREFTEMIAAALLLELTPVAEADNWAGRVDPAAGDACSIDGKWWCVSPGLAAGDIVVFFKQNDPEVERDES